MRLWYQSLTRQSAWAAYNEALRAVLDAAKDDGTTIEVHGIEKRGGVGDQYRYLEFIEAQEVLENVERASREGFDAFLIGNIGDPGLREKLFAVRRMTVDRLVDLNEAFVNPAAGQALIDEFLAAASANVEEGAELVIPAVAVLMVLLARHGINEVSPGIPILNGVTALVKMGEAAVKMRKLFGGSWTSRRAMYAAPPLGQIDELRSFYGPVYPWLKNPDS